MARIRESLIIKKIEMYYRTRSEVFASRILWKNVRNISDWGPVIFKDLD